MSLVLLFVLSAFGADVDPWLREVESELDAAVPSLRTCVAYSRAVDEDHTDILAFELRYGEGKAPRVVAVDQTMMESWITRCMALRLTERSWPTAPIGSANVGFTLNIAQLAPLRESPVFLAHPMPSGFTSVAALPYDMVRLSVNKRVKIGPRCLRTRVDGAGEDLSAHVEAAFTLDSAGYLERGRVVGGEHLGALRECILDEIEHARFPAGYPATAPIWLILELQGSGGAYATTDAATPRGRRAWSWKYRLWTQKAVVKSEPKPPEVAVDRWLYDVDRKLSARAREFQGCVLAEDPQRGDYDVLLVGGPAGIEGVAIATTAGAFDAAPCIARSILKAGAGGVSSRQVLRARIEILPGPATVVSGPVPLWAPAGPWSEAALAAARVGDAEALDAALPGSIVSANGMWTADLPPPVATDARPSWTPGGAWPAWNRLVYGAGDLNAAELELTRWSNAMGGCEIEVGPRDATVLVATAHVDEGGIIHVDPPFSNPLGEATYACLTARLEGQRAAAGGTPYSVIWPATLGHRGSGR
ncbi:hypothetical protein LBMAG42_17420 [Deltaproteobacteria bacterium]|nr:hypothetical protein LBMAG42_17420 [Deltaproteobacteria bacterium]